MEIDSKSNEIPRKIPFGLKLRLIVSVPLFWFGFLFSTIGLTIFLALFQDVDLRSITFSPDKWVDCKINAISPTNSSINGRKIYKYDYEFSINGRIIHGQSYSSDHLDTSTTIQAEFESDNPDYSRIWGLETALFSPLMALFVSIFPIVGLSILGNSLYLGFKNIDLVTNGILTIGKVIDKIDTLTRINKHPLYRIIFEFKTQKGELAHSNSTTLNPEDVLDEGEELLIYDPKNPKNAVLLDTITSSAKEFLLKPR